MPGRSLCCHHSNRVVKTLQFFCDVDLNRFDQSCTVCLWTAAGLSYRNNPLLETCGVVKSFHKFPTIGHLKVIYSAAVFETGAGCQSTLVPSIGAFLLKFPEDPEAPKIHRTIRVAKTWPLAPVQFNISKISAGRPDTFQRWRWWSYMQAMSYTEALLHFSFAFALHVTSAARLCSLS